MDEYKMPHLNKIADFLDETLHIGADNAAAMSVTYAGAIVLNRVANELKRLNDSRLGVEDEGSEGVH